MQTWNGFVSDYYKSEIIFKKIIVHLKVGNEVWFTHLITCGIDCTCLEGKISSIFQTDNFNNSFKIREVKSKRAMIDLKASSIELSPFLQEKNLGCDNQCLNTIFTTL